MREILAKSQRIVIKVGTSILTGKDGYISSHAIARLGEDVLALRAMGKEVAIVSSGAIAFGMEVYGFKKRPKHLFELQACAAIGQGKLMHAYEEFFRPKKVIPAQLLLTRDGIEDRSRFLAARHTFDALFQMKALPIVNENDTVATEEIAFGDNDILSVHVAHLIRADLLVIMSDVDGFYLKDGSRIRLVDSVMKVETELVKHLKDSKKEKTVGGMKAKLRAAQIAMRLGVSLMIVNGHEQKILSRAIHGEDVGTLFMAGKKSANSRKDWIAYTASRAGTLWIDAGASQALSARKKSLLPSGIKKIKGNFEKGDVVEIADMDDKILGRGRVRFSSQDLSAILGKKTSEINSLVGYDAPQEVIHRNDLLLWI